MHEWQVATPFRAESRNKRPGRGIMQALSCRYERLSLKGRFCD
jgi:hypothetical protein